MIERGFLIGPERIEIKARGMISRDLVRGSR
jgi:hypothetical protein